MRIVSFDQSTKLSGYSVFDDGEYVDSGVIDMSKSKLGTDERSFEMAKMLWKVIKHYKPQHLVLENVQLQKNNAQTMIILARLAGMIIGYAEAHKVKTHIVSSAQWRKQLGYTQGPKVKREELKQQSIDYVKEHLGLDLPEDQAESCCMGIAAHNIFNFE